jgi:hypothetical protein
MPSPQSGATNQERRMAVTGWHGCSQASLQPAHGISADLDCTQIIQASSLLSYEINLDLIG